MMAEHWWHRINVFGYGVAAGAVTVGLILIWRLTR